MPKSSETWPSLAAKIEHYLDTTSHPNGCWLWTRSRTPRGYGHVCWDRKVLIVHRAYLKELGSTVPDGMDVDHLCRNTSCSNPDHLEVVTHQVNTQRGEVGKWDRGPNCKHGHEFTPENTYIRAGKYRICRECHRSHNAQPKPCEVCGKEISSANLAAHRRAMHEGRTL